MCKGMRASSTVLAAKQNEEQVQVQCDKQGSKHRLDGQQNCTAVIAVACKIAALLAHSLSLRTLYSCTMPCIIGFHGMNTYTRWDYVSFPNTQYHLSQVPFHWFLYNFIRMSTSYVCLLSFYGMQAA